MISSIMLNKILTKQDVMHNVSTRHKSSLSLINQKIQHKLQLRANEFRYTFIKCVATRDWPEVTWMNWIRHFRNQGNSCVIPTLEHFSILEELSNRRNDIIS